MSKQLKRSSSDKENMSQQGTNNIALSLSKDQWLELRMEEYKALRDEIIDSSANSISVLRFGLLVLSGLIYFGLSNWANGNTSTIVFLFLCPFICYLILFTWLGEVARKYRAGHYIYCKYERLFTSPYDNISPPLYWETWLRTNDPSNNRRRIFIYHRASTVLIFLLTAGISIAIGLYKIAHTIIITYFICLTVGEFTLFVILCIAVFYFYSRLRNW